MDNLSNIGQDIIQQSKEFDHFLDKIAEIEIEGKMFSEKIFIDAMGRMPMYVSRLKNLKSNLSGIQSRSKSSNVLLKRAV